MEKKSYADTPEAAYLAALTWRWLPVSHSWVVEKVQPTIAAKIKSILDEWGLGYYGDDRNCKSGQINLYVTDRQWRRVGIIKDRPEENKE